MPLLDLRNVARRQQHSTSGLVRRVQPVDISSTNLYEEVTGESIVDTIIQTRI